MDVSQSRPLASVALKSDYPSSFIGQLITDIQVKMQWEPFITGTTIKQISHELLSLATGFILHVERPSPGLPT